MINLPNINGVLWSVCFMLTTTIQTVAATKLMVGIIIKTCESGLYRNYSVMETAEGDIRWTYVSTTNLYQIMQKASALQSNKEKVLLFETDDALSSMNILLSSTNSTTIQSNTYSLRLNIYICEKTCYDIQTENSSEIPEDYEDYNTVTRLSASIISHAKWLTVVIIYDNTSTLSLNALHGSLADQGIFVLSYNYDLMAKNSKTLLLLKDVYNRLFDIGINITVICKFTCVKDILIQADKFDSLPDNFRRTAMKQRSCWLFITKCSAEDDIRHFANNITRLDNVVLLDLGNIVTQPLSLQKTDISDFGVTMNRYFNNLTTLNSSVMELEQVILTYIQKLNNTFLGTGHLHPMYTLLYHTKGRRFAPIGYVAGTGQLVTKNELFPNIHYGFNGQPFVVVTTSWTPFVDKRTENGTTIYFGFCLELLDELAKQLNFTYSLVEPPDGEWGRIRKNGTWTGMIGELEMRRVDMMMAPASIQASREMAMDFTYPFYFDTSNFLIKRPDPDKDKIYVYIDPFRWQVYICIGIALPVCAMILYLVEKYNPFFRESSESPHNYQYGFWYMFGALLSQGGEDPPLTQSGRAITFAWWFLSIVIVATYSGNLIAFLTVSKEKLPLSSLEEVGTQDTYKWGTLGGSYFITLFEHSTLPSFKKIWNGLVEFNSSSPDVLDADPDVHIRKVKSEDYIYIGDKISMEARVSNDCSLIISKEEFPNMNYGVGLPNNSLFTEIFSNKILELLESGIFQIWRHNHWPEKKICKGELTITAKKIRLIDVQSAFILIAIGIVSGSIVLLAEYLFKKFKQILQKSRQ